ncbi:MAG TPA: protein-disulfide reductase DsbD family protein [Panacibacter sp.]|nr:protein-disulfide reductase DsbD family protein [Panacibacter sp.]
MKKITIFFITFFSAVAVMAQSNDPVQWNFAAVKKSDKVYELTFTATIAKPWHIYSQTTPKGGALPTKILFKTNPLATIKGNAKETGDLKTIYEDVFGTDVKFFDTKVSFTQTVNLKSAVKTNIAGTVEYLACKDGICLPPKKVPFDLKLQ